MSVSTFSTHHGLERWCVSIFTHYSFWSQEVKVKLATVGRWAFIVGLVLAGVVGLLVQVDWVIWVLALIGVIVGLLNVTAEETQGFLLAAIAFALSATALNTIPFIGIVIARILANLLAFVAGAMIVVALKSLFKIAQ
jgi:hypothetical protein